MSQSPRHGPLWPTLLTALTLLTACKTDRKPVIVLAAASLTRALADLEERLEHKRKDLDLQLEISGSQTACRKISELNRRADVVLTADYRVIDSICRPGHAAFNIHFATNSVVLAHMAHSRHTEEVTAENWPAILMRPKVRLGLVSPDTAPIGYRTLLVWELAGPDLAEKLRARVAKEHLVPHESELLQQLQARAIDYAFVYRSTAEEHNLKVVPLPPGYSLGDADRAAEYARASVLVRMSSREAPKKIAGAPVTYGLTIPNSPPNPKGAVAVVRFLLGRQGQRVLKRTGFTPLSPARCADADRVKLPAELKALVR